MEVNTILTLLYITAVKHVLTLLSFEEKIVKVLCNNLP